MSSILVREVRRLRGDDQLYYELLAGLTGPGRIIVSSAGNDGAKTTYIHKGIGKERAGTFVRCNPKSFGCTAKSRQPFMFRVSIYNKVASPKTIDVSTVRVCSSKDSLLIDSGSRWMERIGIMERSRLP